MKAAVKAATPEIVNQLGGKADLLMVIMAEQDDKYLAQALVRIDDPETEEWFFGDILEFDGRDPLDRSVAGLMAELRSKLTYLIVLDRAVEDNLVNVAIFTRDTPGQVGVGLMHIEDLDLLVTRLIQATDGALQYVGHRLEPKAGEATFDPDEVIN